MMFSVLALGLAETCINHVIAAGDIHDPTKKLSGKTLRLQFMTPKLMLNVLFGDARLRLEPVTEHIFEPQGGITSNIPDAKLVLDNPKMLVQLLQEPNLMLDLMADKVHAIGDDDFLQAVAIWLAHLSQHITHKGLFGQGSALLSHLINTAPHTQQKWTALLKTIHAFTHNTSVAQNPPNTDIHRQMHDLERLLLQKQQTLATLQAKINEAQQQLKSLDAMQSQPIPPEATTNSPTPNN